VQALILAAGRGSRLLAGSGLGKTLVPVLGVPIIDRVITTVRSVGIVDVVVVVGYKDHLIREHLGEGVAAGIRVSYATNPFWEGGNALSVLAARDLIEGDFLLLMGDHLVDDRIVAAMIRHDVAGSVLLAVDRSYGAPDATRVLEKKGRIVDIGKGIPISNATDTGVFRCSPKFLVELDELVAAGASELADAVGGVEAHTFDIATIEPYVPKLRRAVPPWWVDVDTPVDLATAERVLVANASKNASDAFAYWVHTPVENALVRRIARWSWITPNQLSVAVNILAYAATAFFASGLLLAASLLTFVVGLADGLDGKLARVKQQVTKLGSLEHAFDMLYEFSWILALAWVVYRTQGGAAPLLLAGTSVAVIAFYRGIYDQYGKSVGHSLDDAGPFDRHFRRLAGRRNLYNVSILVAVLAGAPLAALWAIAGHAVLTAAVYAVRSGILLHRLDRNPGVTRLAPGRR
jgi:CDP-L-myo-inositol myo-inositolphosphotransferase